MVSENFLIFSNQKSIGALVCHDNQSSNTINIKNIMQPFLLPNEALHEI